MRLLEAQLGGVLDRHDALAGGDERGERVERGRLARAGAAADQDVQPPGHRASQHVAQRRRPGAELDDVVRRQATAAEATDRQDGPVDRQRRDDDIHARAVGQPGVHEWLGLVDAPAERGEDALDRVTDLFLAREARVAAFEAAGALDPDRTRPVDHHLLDLRVAQQRLERTEAERALGDELDEVVARRLVEQRGLAVDQRSDARVQVLLDSLPGAVEQARAQVVGEAVEDGGLGGGLHATRRCSPAGIRPRLRGRATGAEQGHNASVTVRPPAAAPRRSPGGRFRRRISRANAWAAAR